MGLVGQCVGLMLCCMDTCLCVNLFPWPRIEQYPRVETRESQARGELPVWIGRHAAGMWPNGHVDAGSGARGGGVRHFSTRHGSRSWLF